jgi:hypothetical protein
MGPPDVIPGGQHAEIAPRCGLGDLELGAYLAQRHVRALLEPRGEPFATGKDDVKRYFHDKAGGAGA